MGGGGARRAPSLTNPLAQKWGEKRVDWVNRLLYEATQTKPDCISQEPKSPCLGSSGLGIVWESLHFLSFEANHWLCACTLRGMVYASQVWSFHAKLQTRTFRQRPLWTGSENGLLDRTRCLIFLAPLAREQCRWGSGSSASRNPKCWE